MEILRDVKVIVRPEELRVRLLTLAIAVIPILVPYGIRRVGIAPQIVRDIRDYQLRL